MAAGDNTIRPFKVGFPEAELTELRRRVNATRWPERETVSDDSQGVRLAMMQDLARYWGTDYDWRKCEAKLDDLPNFGLCREFCDPGNAGCKMTRLRSRSKLARPYIWRLIILIFLCPRPCRSSSAGTGRW